MGSAPEPVVVSLASPLRVRGKPTREVLLVAPTPAAVRAVRPRGPEDHALTVLAAMTGASLVALRAMPPGDFLRVSEAALSILDALPRGRRSKRRSV